MDVEPLKSLFRSLAPFSAEELDEAMGYFYPETLDKYDHFCRAGRLADRIAYVSEGVLRSYYMINNRENTTFFQLPGSIAVALQGFIQMTPSIENIQALEQAELLVLHRSDLYRLYEENWKWQQVGRILMEQYYIQLEQHMISLQSHSATERYEQLLSRQPEVFHHVQLQFIASYLGISPETLSRIRKST